MRVFLTGATGFVGRNFLTWLVREQPDVSITCLVRDPAKAAAQWPESPRAISWLAGDLLRPDTYRAALAEAELVFHAAALVSLKNGPEFYTMNTDATRCLVEALVPSTALRRLIFIGSISAVDRPLNTMAVGPLTEASVPHPNTDYGKSKLMAERLIVESGLPYAILRPSYIYGPYPRVNSSMDRLIHDVATGKRYTRFPFPGQVSEIYAEDLAEIIWLAGQHPNAGNETFFVGNPEPCRIASVYRDLSEVLGVPYHPDAVSPENMPRYRRLILRQAPDNLMLRILFEDFFLCSPEKWYAYTGYRPKYGYREGLRRTVHWYQRQGLRTQGLP
jgi:dihydroflavonol-4-reductase